MATEKGLCPHCGNAKNIKKRLFVVNTDSKSCFCPHCMKQISPIECVEAFKNTVNQILRQADIELYVKGRTEVAYKMFADVISVDKNNYDAYFGRIKSLIYSSTVRKVHFVEAAELIEFESVSFFHKMEDKEKYFSFISKVNKGSDDYLKTLNKRLMFRTYFYDMECVETVLTRINQIIIFKKALLSEADFLVKHYKNNKCVTLKNDIAKSIEEKTALLKRSFKTMDGKTYYLDRIKRTGEAVAKENKEEVSAPITFYKPYTLDYSNKKLRHIKDNIFVTYRNSFIKSFICFASTIVCFLLGAVSGILCYFYLNDKILLPLFAAIGCIAALGLLVSLTILLILLRYIKKRKLKISQ